jgi:glycosyltransferase involved in cell wall biosynthesis
MKLFYIANIRIPTEKAHGVAIVKSCEAFARAGVETALIVPRRRTPFEKSVFETYNVKEIFSVRFLPTLDLIGRKAGRFVFRLQAFTFNIFLLLFLLFKSRGIVLYTRDPGILFLRYLGYKIILECHLIPHHREVFFNIAKKASRIVVISNALKNAFLKAGFDEDQIVVAPSGVDLSIFDISMTKEEARGFLGLPLESFIAVYTGNFTTMGEDKGISDTLRALKRVPDVIFVAVGGNEKDIARYKKDAHDLSVSDQVILRGTTSQRTLAIYQKSADVLLMPFPDTAHYRNHMSPVKMFEYMASGRPIIASDLPTICEILNDENAIIVHPSDPHAIAKGLERAMKEETSNISDRALEDVKAYSWDVRTRNVLNHIR